ncbi:MAG TPA: SDR family oxidoreductase [Gemmatimonadaceae bacterium]|jgi:3-oxoacyl-[acyl-carrier protein] reductase|nr:SDR family oxidoreductase [Gemmatimonadaceae bacterium]
MPPAHSARPTALVTGASRGIGRAVALRLAGEYDIVAVARAAADLDTLRLEVDGAGGRCTPIVLDLSDGHAVDVALREVHADVVVNNAGLAIMKPLLEMTPEEWHRQVDVNLNALYHVTRAVLPGMVQRGHGHVVIIGSIGGRSAWAGGTAYTATKHAVAGFAESLLMEVRDQGVKVSVVHPGGVATAFDGPIAGGKSWKLKPEDVAEAVAQVLHTPENVLVHSMEIRALSKNR